VVVTLLLLIHLPLLQHHLHLLLLQYLPLPLVALVDELHLLVVMWEVSWDLVPSLHPHPTLAQGLPTGLVTEAVGLEVPWILLLLGLRDQLPSLQEDQGEAGQVGLVVDHVHQDT